MDATAARWAALMNSQAHVPCAAGALFPLRSRTSTREDQDDFIEAVLAMAALEIVMMPQQIQASPTVPCNRLCRGHLTEIVGQFCHREREGSPGQLQQAKMLEAHSSTNLSPKQQRRKAARKGIADALYYVGFIGWDRVQSSKMVNGQFDAVSLTMQ